LDVTDTMFPPLIKASPRRRTLQGLCAMVSADLLDRS
jgi:hypothetical protein